MKRFLYKIAVYFILLVIACLVTVLAFYYTKPKKLLFISNSISYNLKAGFLNANLEKYKAAKIIVFGSSMSLNNVNAKMIQDSLGLPVMNIASWGLKIKFLNDLLKKDTSQLIYINTNFDDFGNSTIIKKNGSLFGITRFSEFTNIMFDFATYISQVRETKNYTQPNSDQNYTNCNFDECGSALFSATGFHIQSDRWDADMFHKLEVDSVKLTAYVNEVKLLIDQGLTNRIIISFSPARRQFYTALKSATVAGFGRMLAEKCPSVRFINLYDENYDDSFFVDNSHFNKKGADRFTGSVVARW